MEMEHRAYNDKKSLTTRCVYRRRKSGVYTKKRIVESHSIKAEE
jgi:hypothetical protein